MKRYMICPVIGDGLTPMTAFRASISDVAAANANWIIPTHASGPDIGKPKYGFCICIASARDEATLSTPSNSYILPDYPLDGRMDGMNADVRTGLVQSVEAYNLDGQGLHFDADHDDADSYRDLLTTLGQQLEPAFNLATFGIEEVAS